jgi:hypothetical protein
MAEIIKPRRWRPPDPENASAAQGPARPRNGKRENKTTWTPTKYSAKDSGARTPRAEVRPYGGTCFFAVYVVWPDGSEDRLHPCADLYAPSIIAQRLNRGFARCLA